MPVYDRAPWDPASYVPTKVGTATFTPSANNNWQGTLNYIVQSGAVTSAAGDLNKLATALTVDPDGRVVYSDHQPPATAREIEAKRLSPNLIENDQLSLAAQRAQDRFPVTLYTFACGDLCERAETLLNRRGVPYTKVNVREGDGAEKLKKLTGESLVPVLQVGDKLVAKGFSDSEWQALLDDAGYRSHRRCGPRVHPLKHREDRRRSQCCPPLPSRHPVATRGISGGRGDRAADLPGFFGRLAATVRGHANYGARVLR